MALFRSLFRAREDVYAVRWEGKGGRSGYSPACRREWNRAYCGKPQVKCAECEHRVFLPLTDQVIRDHLAGRRTVGVYPLLPDETCWFLAVDFDKASWQEDVAAFLGTCGEISVPAALERSRSCPKAVSATSSLCPSREHRHASVTPSFWTGSSAHMRINGGSFLGCEG